MKDRHVEICLTRAVETDIPTGFERYELAGDLPGFPMEALDTSTSLFGRRLALPLFISSMTGGGARSRELNFRLAEAAQLRGLGMAVGSQALMLRDPASAESYQVRKVAPDILLFADLGLVHLNYGLDRSGCLRAVEEIEADALMLYVNPMHEAYQKAGDLDFTGLLLRLGELLEDFPYPVILKEVGFGFSRAALARLTAPLGGRLPVSRRLAGVDVAGLGGTHWGRIEAFLDGRSLPIHLEVLGTPTAASLAGAVELLGGAGCLVFASGGIRNGVEMAKALGLGADAVGIGLPFLRWAAESRERLDAGIAALESELRLAMWHAGARDLASLRGRVTLRSGPVRSSPPFQSPPAR
jgi:isopentenyl-diphosphate delta-isomerase